MPRPCCSWHSIHGGVLVSLALRTTRSLDIVVRGTMRAIARGWTRPQLEGRKRGRTVETINPVVRRWQQDAAHDPEGFWARAAAPSLLLILIAAAPMIVVAWREGR